MDVIELARGFGGVDVERYRLRGSRRLGDGAADRK
jgi:hypothetical protein